MRTLTAVIREYRLLVLIGLILLAVEGGIRLMEGRLSGNINHIMSIPGIVQQVKQAEDDGETVIFLGNSLLNNATDTDTVAGLLPAVAARGIAKITPDGSALAEWFCIYNNHVAAVRGPDLLVIGFAWAQLSDQFPINAPRLGGFFCGLGDRDRLGAAGLADHREFLRFLAGKMSHTYVNRELIRNRLLGVVIPGYEEITQRLNSEERRRGSEEGSRTYSYSLLTELIASVQGAGGRVVLVAMPVKNPYPIDEGLLRETKRLGVALLDYRRMFATGDAVFADPIHLNRKGRTQFSALVAADLRLFFSH